MKYTASHSKEFKTPDNRQYLTPPPLPMFTDLINFIRELYGTDRFIPLHAPTFTQRDKDCAMDAIDSTFVSSVGEYVNRFENDLAAFTGAARAVATR